MYAIIFELDANSPTDGAYKLIRDFMSQNGFSHIQGSVYFGNSEIDAVKCVLTIQRLAREYPWFATCAKDVRMLRIEENNDLLPAIRP